MVNMPCTVCIMDHFLIAVERAGGKSALAKAIGVSPQALSNWVARESVPPKYAALIERETGVPADFLCPDIPWHIIRGREAVCSMTAADGKNRPS